MLSPVGVAIAVAAVQAKVTFDQALGTTLEVNHVSLEEAKSGKVAAK